MNEQEKLLYEAKAAVLKALAHPTRLWMVPCVLNFMNCVEAMIKAQGKDHAALIRRL